MMVNDPIVLTQVTQYCEDDPEGMGDYTAIFLFNDQDELIVRFGDYYHDKGEDKLKGFIEGLKYALNKDVIVNKKIKADYVC